MSIKEHINPNKKILIILDDIEKKNRGLLTVPKRLTIPHPLLLELIVMYGGIME